MLLSKIEYRAKSSVPGSNNSLMFLEAYCSLLVIATKISTFSENWYPVATGLS